MRGKWIVVGLLALVAVPSVAQETQPVVAEETAPAAALQVERGTIALRVEDREPVGDGTQFVADVGQLACFTQVAGAEEDTYINHVWIHGTEEMARVRLPIRGPSWRTWSTKRILPSWTGSWKLEVQDPEGNVLETLPFTVGSGDMAE